MPDYNLSGLSTRSFEQLIQTIAAKVIGPGIVIFGDGPDGGREATFEGSIPYPFEGTGWNGYGVIQAKFRQRPDDSLKDGEWALQQLHSELKKYSEPHLFRRKPEYYIFATNVVLTPVQKKGSKDKAFALIQKFKDNVPLKGYDIWDYDKIRVFLDDSEDIRNSYAAWITTGDVLAQVIKWLKPQKSDIEQVLATFLQKELLADQYVNLEQAGHAVEERISIARVFVDLPAFDKHQIEPPKEDHESGSLPSGYIAEVLDVAKERLNPESLRSLPKSQSLLGRSSSHEPGRFVLIGGPGQGKTTIGQYICQLFRTAILTKRLSRQFSAEVVETLKAIESQCTSEGIGLPSVCRFPIRIILSEFAAALNLKQISLLSYMVDRIHKKTDCEILIDDFRQWLRGYPWLIILDGLDEVPASSNRDDVLAAVCDFWIEASECNADILVIATTRPQGYNKDFSPDLYKHKWLAPLSTRRAMHYAQRLAEVRYGSDQDRKEKVLQRLDRASSHEATARLMRSPLQVTIMTALVDRMGQPPQERWNLFKEYYNVIYQREVERDIPTATILREYKPDIDMIHKYVGLLLQVESERSGKTEARLSKDFFAAVVEARLSEEGHEGENRKALKEKIIEAATNRLVFLVGLQANEVGFEIRSLQEFMAAEGLMEGSDDIIRTRLREIAAIANWRNVFLFAAGKCFAERQHLRDTVHTICSELNEGDPVAHATLAGSQLALDLLEDGPARKQPKYTQSLTRLALRLLDLPPGDYHVRLADLYEPELEHVYREELNQRLLHINMDNYLGSWACLFALIEAEVPWTKKIASNYWPSRLTKKSDLLIVASIVACTTWISSKLVNIVPYFTPIELINKLRVADSIDRDFKISEKFDTVKQFLYGKLEERTKVQLLLGKSKKVLGELGKKSLAWRKEFLKYRYDIFSFGISPINIRLNNILIAIKDLSNTYPVWTKLIDILSAAVRFQKEPSKEVLARELTVIAHEYDDELINLVADKLPWPLGACLSVSDSQNRLYEIINKVKTGEFGDLSDWKVAEERWQKQGILDEDIYYMNVQRWPFDKNIAQHGFPFAVINRCAISMVSERKEFSKELLDIYAKVTEPKMRAHVASWILFILGGLDIYDEITPLTLGQFQSLVNDAIKSQKWISLDTLKVLEVENEYSEQWLDFFDSLGRYSKLSWSKNIEEQQLIHLSRFLTQAFCKYPTRIGIIRILSFLTGSKERPSIPPHLLDPKLFDDQMFREAAIIVRLSQGNWSYEEAGSLAKYTADITKNHLEFIDRVLEVLHAYQIPKDLVNHFLLELHKYLTGSLWVAIDKTIQALNDSLRRRTSRLNDPHIWSELKLPSGLSSLFRN